MALRQISWGILPRCDPRDYIDEEVIDLALSHSSMQVLSLEGSSSIPFGMLPCSKRKILDQQLASLTHQHRSFTRDHELYVGPLLVVGGTFSSLAPQTFSFQFLKYYLQMMFQN